MTLDLSKPTVAWARDNWDLNGLPMIGAEFISGDVFDWLPRLAKKDRQFDLVICDPPSFSRAPSGVFSTAKDLERLHQAIFKILAPGGQLITTINTAQLKPEKFLQDVAQAALKSKRTFCVTAEWGLPESFPTLLGEPLQRYLKGFTLRERV